MKRLLFLFRGGVLALAGSIVTLPYACGMETDKRLCRLTSEATASFDQKSDPSGDSFYICLHLPIFVDELCPLDPLYG